VTESTVKERKRRREPREKEKKRKMLVGSCFEPSRPGRRGEEKKVTGRGSG